MLNSQPVKLGFGLEIRIFGVFLNTPPNKTDRRYLLPERQTAGETLSLNELLS